ncbi:helix-turn-helix domain-containing protein [Paracoccus tegillarcae]|nr:AraC family transcriptional regulator [Paracoccus tegillarcae]
MSIVKDGSFESGFPFTPSRFKGMPQQGAASEVSPLKARILPEIGVNSAQIDETAAGFIGEYLPQSGNRTGQMRSRAKPTSLKALPLASFVWGGRTPIPQPRTRGEMVLIWVTRGRLKLDFPRRTQQLAAGSLCFIPGTAFATLPLADCAGQVLLIAPHLTRHLTQEFPARLTEGRVDHDDPALRQLLHDLAVEARRDTENSRAAIECHLGLLALRLQRLEPAARPIERPPASNPDLPLADRFLTLAETRFADGSTIADLAHELGVTTAELDTACQHKHTKRALDLMNELRLQCAAQMLRETSEDPARIARLLGYSGLAHLSRAFVNATGRLPREFRE